MSSIDSIIKLTTERLSPESIIDTFYRDDCGAVITFIGTIRNTSKDGRSVQFLRIDLCGFDSEEKLNIIALKAFEKWPLKKIAIHRRYGLLKVGEIALIVVISAPRRAEAFDACQYIIDEIKEGDITLEKDIYDVNVS